MKQPSKHEWSEVLEIVSTKRPDQAEAEWAWVMEQLGLGPEYFLGILEAVRQGRWRTAENPGAYLKTAARREQSRLTDSGERKPRGLRGFHGLEFQAEEITLGRDGRAGRIGRADSDGDSFSSEDRLEHLQHRQSSGRPARDPDGTWRTAAGGSADPEGLLSRPVKDRRPRRVMTAEEGTRLARYVERMRAAKGKDERDEPYIENQPERPVDWPGWAQAGGLSDWEQKVVEYRMRGVGWTEAMRTQPDEDSRRALQAAWRKLERTGERRLRANLTTDSDVTDDQG